MQIVRRKLDPSTLSGVAQDLETAVSGRLPEGRVCSSFCSVRCTQCGSLSCQCMCSPDCPEAPQALSSDPDNFPIEAGITSLVFELKRLAVFEPCWSCEGHNDKSGNLWKTPAVWFYCSSALQLRLLNDAIKSLENAGHLASGWQISITHSDPENAETTYALVPAAPLAEGITLADLQADTSAIALLLHGTLREQASNLKIQAGERLPSNEDN